MNYPYIDYDFQVEYIHDSKIIATDCAAITLLNLSNCSVDIDNGATLPVGGSISISLPTSIGIPRLTKQINAVFQNDNTTNPQVKILIVIRTRIIKIC